MVRDKRGALACVAVGGALLVVACVMLSSSWHNVKEAMAAGAVYDHQLAALVECGVAAGYGVCCLIVGIVGISRE